MIERLLAWLLRKIGFSSLVGLSLLGLLLGSVVLGLGQASPGLDVSWLVITSLLGMLLGWRTAHVAFPPSSRAGAAPASPGTWHAAASALGASTPAKRNPSSTGIKAAVWTGLVGLAWNVLSAGNLAREVLASARGGFAWLSQVQIWRPWRPFPDPWLLLAQLADLRQQLGLLVERVATWAARGGSQASPGLPAAPDPLVMALLWGLLLWAAGAWAGWWVRGRQQALYAGLPAAGLLASVLAFGRSSPLYLFPVLGACLGLMAWLAYDQHQQAWLERHVDTAEGLAFDISLWTMAEVLGVISLAYLLATTSPRGTLEAIQRLVQPKPETAEQLSQSLGLQRQPTPTPLPPLPGVLPRRHLIGAGPELGQQPVMTIKVEQGSQTGENKLSAQASSQPGYAFYWRAAAYDLYTGHGWLTSSTREWDYPAGQVVSTTLAGPSQAVTETVQVLGVGAQDEAGNPQPLQVYLAGELTSLDQTFAANWRSVPGGQADLFRVWLPQPPPQGEYQVQARLLAVGEKELRQANGAAPAWIQARYLALPESLPPRVRALGAALGGTADNPYDRAKAIEALLRKYPYTLDLPAPPADKDLSAYFLFDLRRGYCDYYATAMVVLARAAGLPARLSIGYAQGTYNPLRHVYQVSEAEAHSWPEIYFSGIGWVIFEPTGYRPPVERPLQAPVPTPPQTPEINSGDQLASTARATWAAVWPYILNGLEVLAGLAVMLGLIGLAYPWLDRMHLKRLPGEQALAGLYHRLRLAGSKLSLAEPAGQTPYELAALISQRLFDLPPGRNRVYRWISRRINPWLAPASNETRQIVEPYARSAYSPRPVETQQVAQALSAWQTLQRRLWLARLYLRLGRK